MKFFDLVRTVLDDLYDNQIDGSEEDKDQGIKTALSNLTYIYNNLKSNPSPDYNDPIRRFAYLYKYVPAHSHAVYRVIKQSHGLTSFLRGDKISISCLGGGPGSDFLGILKYLIELQSYPEIECKIFDREPGWMDSWDDIGRKIRESDEFSTAYLSVSPRSIDVLQQNSWQNYRKAFSQSQLFTMIYFASELAKNWNLAKGFFDYFVNIIPSSAYIVYIDNDSSKLYSPFLNFINQTKMFTTLVAGREHMKINDYDEQKILLGKYYIKFSKTMDPKIEQKIIYRVFQKI